MNRSRSIPIICLLVSLLAVNSARAQSSIAFDGGTESWGVNTTAFTMAMPAANAGDVCIAQISWDDGTQDAVTIPDGWSRIRLDQVSTYELSQGLYWHVTSADEPTSYTWAITWA
ncbi:MAG: hypothetical protein ACREQN_11665, partial [Candidatus Binataceae bacterium]